MHYYSKASAMYAAMHYHPKATEIIRGENIFDHFLGQGKQTREIGRDRARVK